MMFQTCKQIKSQRSVFKIGPQGTLQIIHPALISLEGLLRLQLKADESGHKRRAHGASVSDFLSLSNKRGDCCQRWASSSSSRQRSLNCSGDIEE